MKRTPFWMAALLAFAFVPFGPGCAEDTGCVDDYDCADALVCRVSTGICEILRCKVDADCSGELVCDDNRCVAP